MNQNSQNKERNEDKILVYDIKKVNENMNNDCKIEEENQTSKEKDIQIKPIGTDNNINNINSHIDNNRIITYEKMNNYYNIQDKNQELKERSNVTQSDDTNNNINNCDKYINSNNYENTERKKVKIKENDPQLNKKDKDCCCCQCCCECISSCGRCLEEFCSCNCCSEYCFDCSECFSICGECLCKCLINSLSHCEIF